MPTIGNDFMLFPSFGAVPFAGFGFVAFALGFPFLALFIFFFPGIALRDFIK
jgi:hypothetical protein